MFPRGQTLASPAPEVLAERAGYFPVAGAHLYTVLHEVERPVARVILGGPFASERHYSIDPWILWARYLAKNHVEVLRYDYRGVGESEGIFEEATFQQWEEDFLCLAGWLRNRSPHLPLILHGLEMGGLLAGRAFSAGMGDILLAWSAPATANLALRPTLIRWAMADQLFKYGADRKPASAYIRQLEEGATIEVEGYRWTSKLWRESKEFSLPPASPTLTKPVRMITLGKEAIPLVKGGPAVADEPWDLTALFAKNWTWLASVLAVMPVLAPAMEPRRDS